MISTDEEYWYLQIKGLRLTEQSLGECSYGPCDAMTAVNDKTGEQVTIYFDVSTSKTFIEKLLKQE